MIPTMLALLSQIRAIIEYSAICQAITLIENREFSPQQYVLKLHIALINEYLLQIRFYVNRLHIDYAYQLFSHEPLIRWDNKEEYPSLSSHPHHFHNTKGQVVASDLCGDPLVDLPIVLAYLENFLVR